MRVLSYCRPAGREVPLAATRIYELSFFTGFGVSAIIYWALNRCYPVIGAADTFEETDVSGYEACRVDASRDTDIKDGVSDTLSER
jgi:NCS1 family nucleobase:cation symporter-1